MQTRSTSSAPVLVWSLTNDITQGAYLKGGTVEQIIAKSFITNNTVKIQLKMHGRTFRLSSDAIVNAKKLTLCWILSHVAKKRETKTKPGEVLVGHALNRWSGKVVESKLRSGLSC